MNDESLALVQRSQEGQVIGHPDHDWDVDGSSGRWKCRRCSCTIVCESSYPSHDPLYDTSTVDRVMLLNTHDRTCPCACYHCSRAYEAMVKEVQIELEKKPGRSDLRFIEGFLALTAAIDRWEQTHRPARFAHEMELRKLRQLKNP